MQEEKIFTIPPEAQEQQIQERLNTTSPNNSHFAKSFTSNVDTLYKSVSHTKTAKGKKENQDLTEEEKQKAEKKRVSKKEREKAKGVSYDAYNDTLTIEKNGLLISVEDYKSPSFSGLSLSTTKTLDKIKTEYTRTGNNDIKLHISEFANRGIKDKRKLKETINKDISNLYHVSLAYTDSAKKNPKKLKLTRIIDGGDIKISTKNGLYVSFFQGDYLVITLAPGYTNFLDKNAISYVDDRAYIMDNANAYAIYARIIGQHNMNQGSIKAYVIPNQTLIDACPKISSKEQIKATGDRHTNKIVERVERALKDIHKEIPDFSYEPCTKEGVVLTEEEKTEVLSSEDKYSNGYTRAFIKDFPYDKKKIDKNTEKREGKGQEKKKEPRKKKSDPKKDGV